ncbi:MAG: long-chain-fatty-acid--CoA ligase [Proteobacteria bacterium]|nr:long-chain-fatty-acid--CoA ligase [Pseudomonadota bacterium]
MGLRFCEPAAAAYAYPLILRHVLRSAVTLAPQQQIVYRDRRFSYSELAARVDQLALALARLGVGPGSMVAVMDWDSHRYLEAFLAIPMMGAVLMTVNVRLSADQVGHTLRHSGAEVLVLNSEFAAAAAALLPSLSSLQHIIWISDEGAAPPSSLAVAGEYEALLALESGAYPWKDFDEQAQAVQFYTTGTTGLPKAVGFSHRQILLKVLVTYGAWAAQAPGQSFRQGDVYMPITPMFHVQAWAFPYVALLLGVKHIYPGKYDPPTLLRLVKEEGVTFSHCVPTLLDIMLHAPESRDVDLAGWKVCVGGAGLSPGLAKAALTRGIDVFAGYGLSETYAGTLLTGFGGDYGLLPEDAQLDLRCKAGRALPLVEVRVVDERMRDVPHDGRSAGELVVRTPWALQGYLGMPDDSKQLWRDGYLHTQDLATIDPGGYVTIVDRLKDVIKSGGEWISSLELESLLSRHPEVAEAAVIAVADERWGERPVALVVARLPSSADLPDRLRTYLSALADEGHISRYAIPARIDLVTTLPKTSVGKLDKKALRALHS